MTSLKKNFKIFLFFSRYSFKTIFQARLGVIFFMVGKIIRFFFFFFLIYLIFSRINFIKGYSFEQAIIFYLSFNIVDTAAQ
ncbi:hypothetical protein HYW87_01070, partial [Candidatus Roizmanbacteria bacterium]|nr:hypothetical protein [Candidatus Roizmanbacteria bacterium]